MPGTLTDNVALATGGASGIGRATALTFARVWLCSDAASFVTGLTMTVDGGYVAQ